VSSRPSRGCVFVNKATASNRIVFSDLRRLQRNVLPRGASSREEIETLLSLDSVGQVDEDWPDYLVETVVRLCSPALTRPATWMRTRQREPNRRPRSSVPSWPKCSTS
jgi:hypothetical protein